MCCTHIGVKVSIFGSDCPLREAAVTAGKISKGELLQDRVCLDLNATRASFSVKFLNSLVDAFKGECFRGLNGSMARCRELSRNATVRFCGT